MQNQYWMSSDLVVLNRLAKALNDAAAEGRKVRIQTDSENNLRFKVGEGMWSPPLPTEPDPYRDNS